MELTTGAILRRITHTNLSCAAHKLATLILDGVAWKEGYNGLPHGTAAFTLSDLAERMEVSRQHLHSLLTELATSGLRLLRHRGKGRFAPWLFRFVCCDEPDLDDDVSTTADISPYIRDSNGSDDVTAPRRHLCAKVGLQRSTEGSGHVGDYHGRARPGEECVPGAWSR